MESLRWKRHNYNIMMFLIEVSIQSQTGLHPAISVKYTNYWIISVALHTHVFILSLISQTFNKVESDVSVFNGNTNTSVRCMRIYLFLCFSCERYSSLVFQSGDGFGGWNDGESSGDTQFGGGFSESKRGGGFGRGRGRGRGRGGFGQNNSEEYSSRNGGFGSECMRVSMFFDSHFCGMYQTPFLTSRRVRVHVIEPKFNFNDH